MGLIQFIQLQLEERAKTQLVTDMRAAGALGVVALRQEFNRKMGDLKADFSQGLIDEPTFRAQARRVADAFNQEVIKRMDALKAAGQDTSKEYAELGRQIKIASDTGIQRGGALTAAWGKVKAFATGMGAAIAAAFTVRAVVDFAKESVNAAVAVGKSWLEIGNAVRSVGGDFVKMRPQIEDTVERISKSLAFDDEEIRDGLTRFIRATGSVDKGLRGIEVAAKLARAGGISVQQATDLLTRALETGNTRGLTPFVGNLKGTGDVLGDVDRKLGDVAATVTPFQRGTLMLSEAWEDLHVAFGNVLISGAEGASVFDALQGILQQFTGWVIKNKDEIGRWVKGGLEVAVAVLKFLGKTVMDTGSQIGDLADFMKRVDVVVRTAWNAMLVGVASSVQKMLGVILKLQGGMLALAEALPGKPFAEQIRTAMERTSGYIGGLETFIAEKSTEMKRDLGGDDAGATKTDSLGGALAVNTAAGSKKAEGSIDRLSKTVSKAHEEMRAEQQQTTEELQQAQESIQSAYIKTGDTASQQGALIEQATRDAIAAKKAEAEEIERTNAASQNYAEEYWKRDVPLFLQGQKEQQDALHKTRDAGTEAAEKTKGSWLDALNVMNSAFQNLSSSLGGALKGIVDGMGQVVGAASAIGSGIAGIGSKVGGLTGLLTKLAGGASVIGGIITGAGIAIDLIKGIGKALGLGDSLWAQTNQESMELYRVAIQTQPSAARTAALEKLAFRSTHLPDAGNRANAKILYEDALLVLAGKKQPIGFEGPSGVPTSPTAPPPAPTGGTDFGGSPTPTAPTVPWVPPIGGDFQHGGWVRQTGPIGAHTGELVLPGTLAQQLLSVAGMQSRAAVSNVSTDNSQRSLNVNVYLSGVSDQDIPRRVVEAVKAELGRDYQNAALLQGNARLPG